MAGVPRLRFATRGSRLALVQTHLAIDALRAVHGALEAQLEVEIVEITTEGDRDQASPLTEIGGRGVFTSGVEGALLDGRADVAVHSLKDLPTEHDSEDGALVLAAMLERADPRDVFVGRAPLAGLPAGARVGTSSNRRAALLRARRSDLEAVSIRGNVDTRMRKVADGEVDGVILAAAGLDRLGRLGEATEVFDALEWIPSPGQGVVVLQCRADDESTRSLLARADHAVTRAAAKAERGFLRALGSGCRLPVGAFARIEGQSLVLRGMLGRDDGGTPALGDASGAPGDAAAIGRGLAERLLQAQGVPA